MATELKVPTLGESISEAVIAKWLKQVGEPIAADEPIVDLETDKVSVQLPAPSSGVLAEQRFAAGATVRVGDVIGAIEAGPEVGIAKNKATEATPVAPPLPTRTDPHPAIEAVATGQVAPKSAIGALPLATTPAPATTTATAQPANGEAQRAAFPTPSHLTPTERKAMREGATPTAVAPVPTAARPATPTPAPVPVQAPRPAGDREEVVTMSPLRRRIAERLVEAQHTAAILTTFNEVDMSAVMALRAKYQDEFVKRHEVKLGFMSFFVRACVEAAKLYPGLNAEIRGNDIVYKKHYDFGIAVGSGRGLVVPVVRGVDAMSLGEIEKEIARLAAKAKDNKLTLDDLAGGTFTISNGGIYGSMMSTPLLNMPQTGILGMHNIVKRAVVVGDEIQVRPMMYLALSYDHRVVDGREAVSFLVAVKERIEAPERLLLAV
jgi:2-oxoglutarate dehydrogenase E2 component (dihydrolipoamide succinyltransferase)